MAVEDPWEQSNAVVVEADDVTSGATAAWACLVKGPRPSATSVRAIQCPDRSWPTTSTLVQCSDVIFVDGLAAGVRVAHASPAMFLNRFDPPVSSTTKQSA
jgi:hypothetical protein